MIERQDLTELDYGIAMSVNALVTAMGMQAENQARLQRGESIAYPHTAFESLLEERGVYHNAVLTRWRGL